MKKQLLSSCLFLFFHVLAHAQEPVPVINLKSGSVTPVENITTDGLDELNRHLNWQNGKSAVVLQFDKIPTAQQREELSKAGITLLDYVSGNAYSASITGKPDPFIYRKFHIISAFQLSPKQKMQNGLAAGIIPSWASKGAGLVEVWISYIKSFSFDEVKQALQHKGYYISFDDYRAYNVAGLLVPRVQLEELAALPFVEYVQPAPHGDQKLNLISRTNARANVLNAPALSGGFDLKGENVTVGVGDDADPQYHIDFTGRLINRAGASPYLHGTHVTGTVGGAGNILEDYRGYAPRSTIVAQLFSGILSNAATYVSDYNMVVTNNSYGDIAGDCAYAGTYDLISRIVDLQAEALPHLQHVFAAGNDGTSSCSPYPAAFKTVLGSYQSAKNVLVVGSLEKDFSVSSFSSRGPVKDGRTKPEIMSYGRFLISTYPNNTYGYSSGTSMAAPGVSGGLVLLYQRYRQLNAGADPDNGLMKALMCNGANDLGNAGVDYTYGYGAMNLLRSVDMMNNGRYLTASLANGANNNHIISVPANTARLKVMLYWNDPAAAAFAGTTLVNDLDLELTDPSSAVHYPWLLDTVPGNVGNAATTGADHMNNMEQVVITNPASGNYTVTVKGTSVTQSPPQKYYLVYDIVPVSTLLTYPVGGETWTPGETVTILWESYGDPVNPFTVEYSTDNGGNWTVINNNVAAGLRQLDWVVPSVATHQALVRITRNGTALVSTSQPFTIIGVPAATLSATQCEGYISLDWAAVTGATDYEVYRLIGNEMSPVATTAGTNYMFSGLSPDTTYWVSVRARVNGSGGKRAAALGRQPNSGTCAGTISDNDLQMDSILTPVSGRIATSTALTASTPVQVRIKNLDDASVTGFDIRYAVNGGAWNTETVNTPVAGGAYYTHVFAATYDFSAPGNYVLTAEVINQAATDPVTANNMLVDTIKQIANDPVTLPFTDDLESAVEASYYRNLTGVNGIERYDYTRTFYQGRLSTGLNTGLAYSGNRSLLLDLDGYNPGGNTNYVTGTYNLNSVNTAVQDIRFDVQYKQHGDSISNPANAIWIRGDDTQPWIEAFRLSNNHNEPGFFKKIPSIEVSDLLTANGQAFSSSFQVRFGQFGLVRISDNFGFHGNSFDDIRLYEVMDDMQMIAIDTPAVNSCGLSSTTPVRIQVRNASSAALNNIPVKFSVDGGPYVTESVPSVGGESTASFTFSATADLSAPGAHILQVIVSYPSDDFPDNDTLSVDLINSPVINTFPYLQNFEADNGYWYATGTNSSWAYGTPASTKIKRAASGSKAWKTGLSGNYNNMELSYLYSPCFDISGMTSPSLSFSVALDFEDCGATLCDGAYVEYSADGITWMRLGTSGAGTNWYNKAYAGNNLWSVENYTRWHVATMALPNGFSSLRLRFVITSDPFVTREGMAIDDIHIYDNTEGIYDGATMGAPVTQTVSGGTDWIDFTSGGKRIASLQPDNLILGNTDVQAYINTGAVRNDGTQYYHDRNITIKPANTSLADSVTVRFYFLDTETENLINATGCSTCTKPSMAYELGVSKFTHSTKSVENGTISDNTGGAWLFISPDEVTKVPYDKGYYAEFKVKDFSEFWLNNGGLDNLTPLPVELVSFTARKLNGQDVLVEWRTGSEYNVDHFEIEVAKGNSGFQNGSYSVVGTVNSAGNTASGNSYRFTDGETVKSGTRYYRLKIVDRDGSFAYSLIRPVVFESELKWDIYPNPSSGLFNFVYQLNSNEQVELKVFDVSGRQIKQLSRSGTGFVQKLEIDLRDKALPSGIYLLQADAGEIHSTYRLIKK